MRELVCKLGICLFLFGGALYSYLDGQNAIAELRMEIPERSRQIAQLREENRRMRYEVERFESPAHLIELAHRPEFCHLKHPLLREILTVPEALAVND